MQDNTDNLITARGTGDGLTIRLSSGVDTNTLLEALREYIEARKSFLAGNQVNLDWSAGVPSDELIEAVTSCLKKDFNIKVKERVIEAAEPSGFRPPRSGDSEEAKTNGLFGGIDSIEDDLESQEELTEYVEKTATGNSSSFDSASNSMFWDNPDAMIVYATLRSGQKIETENSIVLVGDVNYGAEIVAGGDVIVLGILRGVVHAGAYDETGGGRFIFALDLRPTQLRIGSIISRGMEQAKKLPEIAYVDGNSIVVEYYNSRSVSSRLR